MSEKRESYTTLERKRLAMQVVRLCLSGRAKSPVVKNLQAECRVLERAAQDLPKITREVVHAGAAT